MSCPSAGFNVGLDQFMDDDLEIQLDHPEEEFESAKKYKWSLLAGMLQKTKIQALKDLNSVAPTENSTPSVSRVA